MGVVILEFWVFVIMFEVLLKNKVMWLKWCERSILLIKLGREKLSKGEGKYGNWYWLVFDWYLERVCRFFRWWGKCCFVYRIVIMN